MQMILSMAEILIVVAVSATALGAVVLMTLSRGKTLYPVHCAHCWVHYSKETVVTFSEEEHRWAICPDCTRSYWQFK